MRSPCFVFVLSLFAAFLAATTAHAQAPDSAQHRYDSLVRLQRTKADSVSDRFNNRIDSIQLKANNILQPDLNKLTSGLKRKRTTGPDSLQAARELDSIRGGLRGKIDSLQRLNLPTDRYTSQLDSINQLNPQKYIQLAQQEVDDVRNRLTQPVNNLQQKIAAPANAVNEKLELMRSQGGTDANLPGNISVDNKLQLPGGDNNLNVPGLDGPDINSNLPNIDNPLDGSVDASKITGQVTELKNLPQDKLADLKQSGEIKNVSEKMSEGNALVDKGQAYQQDAMKIVQGKPGELEQIPEALEQQAIRAADLGDLQQQEGAVGEQLEMLNKAKDPEALKQEVKQQAIRRAKDHFAGRQEVLTQAMDKMAKLKSKYDEVTSLADLKKKSRNAMKGKPFVERVVPGMNIQIQKSNAVLIDINPVVSYRISGRVSAGGGWNERLAFVKWNRLSMVDRIYGPRAFVSVGLKRGFSVKAEAEKMSTWVPSLVGLPDGERDWVWSVFAGVKKDYRFSKRVNGNVQVLYNFYDDGNRSPYVDKLNVRMGFEVPMKKRKK